MIAFHGLNTVTFDVSSPMSSGVTYVVNVAAGAQDLAGNGVTPPFTSSFTIAGVADNTAPTVAASSPIDGATIVPVNSPVTATFSEAMNASTIGGSSVTLTPAGGGAAIPATVSYNGTSVVVTLSPSAALAFSTPYTLSVTTAVRDVAGNFMASPFAATFTTAAAGDLTAPTVTSVAPVSGATGVAVNSSVVVTFSEAMTAASVTGSTFTLTPSGGSPVPATVTYNAGPGTATLAPSSALANNTSYTVNVTSGAKDLSNNGLTPFSSTFTTDAAGDITPPTVSMLSPANGATGVATNATMIFRFNEVMNLSTINTSSVTLAPAGGSPVAGVIGFHGLNSVSFDVSTPMSQGTTYVLTVTSGAQDVAGNGVSPQFTSSFTTVGAADNTPPAVTGVTPLNAATNVAVASNVVVSFSEAMTAGTVTNSTFTLTPTAGGSPVTASVVYSSGSATLDPAGDLAYSTSYTVNVTSGAKDLANNGLTPFSSTFTTAAAPDLASPTVTSVTPLNAATNVAITSNVVVNFSEAMTAGTVTTSTFTLTPTAGGSPVTASVVYGSGSATLDPASNLAYSTSYTVNVTSGAADLAGNGLTPFSSTFTTAAPPDLTPPTVTVVSPLNNATNVAVASNVVVTFSEAMSAGTVTTSTFTLTPTAGGSPVAASVVYSAGSATLNPTSNLAFGTSYTVNVTSGAKDLANNGLTPFSSTFTTIPPELTAPTVTSVSPANRSVDNSTTTQVRVTFNEPIDPATITASTFTVREFLPNAPFVSGTRSYDPATNTIVFTSSAPFKNHESYEVKVTTGVRDIAGNPLAAAFASCFTPTAGTGGAVIGLTGRWSGNDACLDGHWHLKIVQTGNTLSLGTCTGDECVVYGVSPTGVQALGGETCPPSNAGGPVLCAVDVVSLSGTVSGSAITFTFITENGLSFTFNGTFSATGTTNPYLTGTISGGFMQTAGMNIETQGL